MQFRVLPFLENFGKQDKTERQESLAGGELVGRNRGPVAGVAVNAPTAGRELHPQQKLDPVQQGFADSGSGAVKRTVAGGQAVVLVVDRV